MITPAKAAAELAEVEKLRQDPGAQQLMNLMVRRAEELRNDVFAPAPDDITLRKLHRVEGAAEILGALVHREKELKAIIEQAAKTQNQKPTTAHNV